MREKVYLTADELLRLSGALEDKILPRLRSIEVTGDGIGNTNTLINVLDGLDERTLKNLVAVLQPQAATAVSPRHRAHRGRAGCHGQCRCAASTARLASLGQC